jgi:2-enoate reductase
VPVHYSSAVNADIVKIMGVDVAIFAIGSVSLMPATIPGIDSAKSVSCVDALLLVGAEMAYEYAKEGKRVTLVEALDRILTAGPPVSPPVRDMLIDLLDHLKVNVMTGHKLEAVTGGGAVVADKAGVRTELAADNVIIAIGFKPLPAMTDKLLGSGIEVYTIGDGSRVGNIQTAISDAYEVTRKL